MKKALLLLALLPLCAVAQIDINNFQEYVHGTYDIAAGGGSETDPKQYSRVEILDDVFGHRITIYGHDNETGKDFADEYTITKISHSGVSNWRSGFIYCYKLNERRDTVKRNFCYKNLKPEGLSLTYINKGFKLVRTSPLPGAVEPIQQDVVSVQAQPAQSVLTVQPAPDVIPTTLTAAKETFTINGVTFNLIRVDGGTFVMGYPGPKDRGAYDEERPQHPVTLSSYYILETEVTQELFAAVMGQEKYEAHFHMHEGRLRYLNHPHFPMDYLNRQNCIDFCNRLATLTGHKFRLPTEAEWEYAARGGNKSRGYLYSGSDNPDEVGWYSSNSGGDIHDVAQKKPNELGIYDMSGNVFEWCIDPDGNYTEEAQTNPQAAAIAYRNGKYIIRGGTAYGIIPELPAWQLRTTYRTSHEGKYGAGFRFVVPVTSATQQPVPGNTTISGRRVTTDDSSQQQQPRTGNTTISGRRVR